MQLRVLGLELAKCDQQLLPFAAKALLAGVGASELPPARMLGDDLHLTIERAMRIGDDVHAEGQGTDDR